MIFFLVMLTFSSITLLHILEVLILEENQGAFAVEGNNSDDNGAGVILAGNLEENSESVVDSNTIKKSNKSKNNSGLSPQSEPTLKAEYHDKFELELFTDGLKFPTDMIFTSPNDLLVLEKNKGTVRKIVNANLMDVPLLDFSVATVDTRGLLGIAMSKNETSGRQYLFIYYTEARDGQGDGKDKCITFANCLSQYQPNGNRLHRYQLTEDGSNLVNQTQIFSWNPFKGASHNGGKIAIGPDNNLYIIVGDGNEAFTVITNSDESSQIDGRGGILVLNQSGGAALPNGIIGTGNLANYFAYGVRNGFGLDFDHVTQYLWDTENGPSFGDEINLVEPGFNSGWREIQGVWKNSKGNPLNERIEPNNLIDFDRKGKYSDPEFAFLNTTGVTAIKFYNSDKMGPEFKDDAFVGDIKYGKIYHFELSSDRKSLALTGDLSDKIANTPQELDEVTFAEGFSGVTDLEVGPDGYLYVLSYGKGAIYRILPK